MSKSSKLIAPTDVLRSEAVVVLCRPDLGEFKEPSELCSGATAAAMELATRRARLAGEDRVGWGTLVVCNWTELSLGAFIGLSVPVFLRCDLICLKSSFMSRTFASLSFAKLKRSVTDARDGTGFSDVSCEPIERPESGFSVPSSSLSTGSVMASFGMDSSIMEDFGDGRFPRRNGLGVSFSGELGTSLLLFDFSLDVL